MSIQESCKEKYNKIQGVSHLQSLFFIMLEYIKRYKIIGPKYLF